jgi:hypothetical protein
MSPEASASTRRMSPRRWGAVAMAMVLGSLVLVGTVSAEPAGELEDLPPLPSSTSLKCPSPVDIYISAYTTCTATVTGGANPFFPRGRVQFAGGTASNPWTRSCGLTHLTNNRSRCQVEWGWIINYDGQAITTTATYAGESGTSSRPGLEPSEASASVEAISSAPASTTTVDCVPRALRPNETTTCTATVVDTSGMNTPQGVMRFPRGPELGEGGEFCLLAPLSSSAARCSVRFTPPAPGTFKIAAEYESNGRHGKSTGSQTIVVS